MTVIVGLWQDVKDVKNIIHHMLTLGANINKLLGEKLALPFFYPSSFHMKLLASVKYSGIAFIRLWFNSNIALNRTKFEVPGQALYISIEKSLVSSNSNRVNRNILEEQIIPKMFR